MASGLIIGLSSLAMTYVFLRVLLSYTHGSKEPTAVATEIPFLSPLIGMAQKSQFYISLRQVGRDLGLTIDKYNLPIYTLRLPGSRIYIVNSTNLISDVQRQVRALDFAPIEARAAINVMGATPAGKEILNMNRNGVGKHSYAIEFDKAIHPAMTAGANLDAMNRHSIEKVSAFLDTLASSTPDTLQLFAWVRKNVAWATTEAVYGPGNPFRDPEIIAAFWKFEPGIVILLLQFFPSILARESLRARERLVSALTDYFRTSHYKQGSALVRARFQHSADYNVSTEDIARFELGGAVAILTNTIPSAFWVLWHIISDKGILEECRHELQKLCKVEAGKVTLDITEVKTSCPLLLSTLKEVLRFHGTGTSVRAVQQDCLLDGKYLLKKGGTLMIPGPVQHTSKAIYGDTASDFDHKRFLRTRGQRPNPVGFRGFGGGSTLCPGRHFASTEIIAFVALMILRFNVNPVDGEWIRPTTKMAGMQATVPPPDADVNVQVTLRESEWAGLQWNVGLTGSDKNVEIVAEDGNQS